MMINLRCGALITCAKSLSLCHVRWHPHLLCHITQPTPEYITLEVGDHGGNHDPAHRTVIRSNCQVTGKHLWFILGTRSQELISLCCVVQTLHGKKDWVVLWQMWVSTSTAHGHLNCPFDPGHGHLSVCLLLTTLLITPAPQWPCAFHDLCPRTALANRNIIGAIYVV